MDSSASALSQVFYRFFCNWTQKKKLNTKDLLTFVFSLFLPIIASDQAFLLRRTVLFPVSALRAYTILIEGNSAEWAAIDAGV